MIEENINKEDINVEKECMEPCHPSQKCEYCKNYWDNMIANGLWDENKNYWTNKAMKIMLGFNM